MKAKSFYTVKNEAGQKPEICIFGYIGNDDEDENSIGYSEFRNLIRNLSKEHDRCAIKFNSGGGDMIDGLAIYDEMKRLPMLFDGEIVGMAASITGVIAMACDTLKISENGSLMIHKPQSVEVGEATAMRSKADFMDSLEKRVIAIFMNRTGKTEEEVKAWMQPGAMTWFNADEAIENKLCDGKIPSSRNNTPVVSNSLKNEKEAWAVYMNFTKPNKPKMKKVLMVLTNYKVAHSLTEESTDETVSVVVENALKDRDEKIEALQAKINASEKANVDNVLQEAVDNLQITEKEKETYRPILVSNFEAGKALINKIPKGSDINNNLDRTPAPGTKGTPGSQAPGKVDASDKSQLPANKADWTLGQYERFDPNGLGIIMSTNPTKYAEMFKAEYGKDYKPATAE